LRDLPASVFSHPVSLSANGSSLPERVNDFETVAIEL
jgi:hypothetical protein